jgi:hypothetical protein
MITIYDKIIDDINKFIEVNQLMLLKNYLKIFIKEYDEAFEYFHDFILFDDLNYIIFIVKHLVYLFNIVYNDMW